MIKVDWLIENNRVGKDVLGKLEKSFAYFLDKNLGLDKVFCLSITLCGDDEIIQLNSEYRDKNKVTDVLSFPIFEDLRSNHSEAHIFEEVELGDIYICESVCEKQAQDFELEFYEEFIQLAFHGFLHLLGFDHEISEKEDQIMQLNEKKLVEIYKSL